jgi:inner membrane protein
MGGYRAHIFFYAVFSGLMVYGMNYYSLSVFDGFSLIAALIVGLAYSLLPDIDAPSSKARRFISKAVLLIVSALLFAYLVFGGQLLVIFALPLVLFLLILWFSRHRGRFHTITAGAIMSLPLLLYSEIFFVFALLGYASHLVADGKLSL